MRRFSHLDPQGRAKMVDVTAKPETAREAVARGHIACQKETIRLILDEALPKGDVLATARVAGILAAKRVDHLIPLCHPLLITSAEVTFAPREAAARIDIESRVKTTAKTGAEMEALAAVSVAALTIYDMCKAVDRGMVIGDVRLVAKRGGKSGEYLRPGEE